MRPVSPTQWRQTTEVLHEVEGIPRAPILVSPELDAEGKRALQATLVDAPTETYYGADGESGTQDDLWFTRVREAGADTYRPVVDVVDELDLTTSVFSP